jgi:hypothetical protein
MARPNPFQRPGETPQKTGTRFERFFAKLLGVEPVRGSGNQWHAPLDVGTIAILFNLKWSAKDVLRFGRYQIWELFRETREATKSGDKTGAIVLHEESTGKTYVIFEADDWLRMSQTGDITYLTPSKGEQKRARSRIPALLRGEDD